MASVPQHQHPPYSVMFDSVSISDWEREVVPPRLRVSDQERSVLILTKQQLLLSFESLYLSKIPPERQNKITTWICIKLLWRLRTQKILICQIYLSSNWPQLVPFIIRPSFDAKTWFVYFYRDQVIVVSYFATSDYHKTYYVFD